MIDLLKNYKQLQNAQGYTGSLRYYLAKKKLDTLFMKWLYSNQVQVQQLLQKAKAGKLKASEEPNPLFSHHRVPHQNVSLTMSSTLTPPRGTENNLVSESNKKYPIENSSTNYLAKSTLLSKTIKPEIISETIPQFYFSNGKALDPVNQTAAKSQINTIFNNKNDVDHQQSKKLITDIFGLPIYFRICLFSKLGNPNKITRMDFNRIWKEFERKDPSRRAFQLLISDKNKKYLQPEDFKKLFKEILATHPGLQFLIESPQFQDWYSICVINRMFFMANRKGDYKMSYRQFKKSKILKSLFDIETEVQINDNKDFFSYQDFYVVYIKFWELDSDHDFYLTKEELSKYSGYTLSRKAIERIFSQVGRKFQHDQKMTFGDFCWFIYCVEDKTTEQSIEYWFKILDLDNNGVVSGYELEFFYEEQHQRLAYMEGNTNDFNFENIVCQMVDLMKPQNGVQFTLDNFLSRRIQCGLFINFLTDLNKLVAFEQRDAYEERNEKNQHPEWTEWDRFVKPEYKRVENTGEYDEGEEMLNWEDDA